VPVAAVDLDELGEDPVVLIDFAQVAYPSVFSVCDSAGVKRWRSELGTPSDEAM